KDHAQTITGPLSSQFRLTSINRIRCHKGICGGQEDHEENCQESREEGREESRQEEREESAQSVRARWSQGFRSEEARKGQERRQAPRQDVCQDICQDICEGPQDRGEKGSQEGGEKRRGHGLEGESEAPLDP